MTLEDLRSSLVTMDAGTERKIAANKGATRVHCVLVRAGALRVALTHDAQRCWQVDSGSGIYLWSDEDYLLEWIAGTEVIVIAVAEETIAAFGAVIDRAVEPLFADDSAILGPTIGFFSALLIGGVEPERVAAYALARLAEEMIGSLFLERGAMGIDRVQARPSLYNRALSLIAAKRAEPTLTAATLASELAVSVRHLQRAFREQRSSPTAEIRRLRVELAQGLLLQSRYDVLSILEIAQYSGFVTPDDLRRALRLEGLPSPSRVRARRS